MNTNSTTESPERPYLRELGMEDTMRTNGEVNTIDEQSPMINLRRTADTRLMSTIRLAEGCAGSGAMCESLQSTKKRKIDVQVEPVDDTYGPAEVYASPSHLLSSKKKQIRMFD